MNKAKITGIGGIFFKSKNQKELAKWYYETLGILENGQYHSFKWSDDPAQAEGTTAFSIMEKSSDYFEPKSFMVNFRVQNLEEFLKILKDKNVKMDDKIEKYEYGKFAWIYDPDGNKIELWEPVDSEL